MKKLIIRVLIGLVILLILAIVAVGLFLDGAVKKGVETVGPMLTKVDVKLDSVSLSLLSGSGKIKGLVVGNPEGFKTPNAIKMGSASLSISPASLLSDKIVVRSMRVEAPEITYEGGLLGGDKLHKILDNVTAAAGRGTGSTNSSGKPAKKLQIDDFLITGARVNVSLKGTGGFAAPIALPDIHFTGLGQGPDGITAADLTRKVLAEVSSEVTKVAVKALGDVGKTAVEAAGNAGKAATESVGKATKDVTDLFKKKKE
jgi:uncharacterized protein involved in outer membrane biogenesis